MQRQYNVLAGGTIICETGKPPKMRVDCLGDSVIVERAWAADVLCKWRAGQRISAHQQNAPYRR